MLVEFSMRAPQAAFVFAIDVPKCAESGEKNEKAGMTHFMSHQNLILIGFRATGKTSVGRLLAARLGWDFFDVDEHIEANFGGSIADIFAAEGEIGFRKRESQSLITLCGHDRRVIATGGGAILSQDNRTLLRSMGFVVWLTAESQTIWNRLKNDPTTAARRPNLTASGGLDEVRALLAIREPLYRETADFVANTDDPSPESVAAAILTAWTG